MDWTQPLDWTELVDVVVLAKPQGLWTLAHEYVQGPALIKVESVDRGAKWKYSPANECTADGDVMSMISTQSCLLKGGCVGALIGKVGGSTAGTADGATFLAGASCIYVLEANKTGPLYLTINDEPTGMSNNDGKLEVKVSIRLNPQAAQAAPNPSS